MAKKARRTVQAKEESQKFLADVPAEYVFWCCDGRMFRNMKELGDAFDTMTDETFAYHANTDKNDFSNWVRDIIKDEKLAIDLMIATNKAQAAKTLASRLSFLTRNLV